MSGRRALSVVLGILIASSSLAAPVQLVTDGKSEYVIQTNAKPTPAEELAAQELQKYVKQMSGAELPITGSDTDHPEKSIQVFQFRNTHTVTVHRKTTDLLQHTPKQDETYEIKTDGQQIQLIGHDSRAVLYAVYQFLDSIGCRFLAPELPTYNGSAEFVSHETTITFDAKDVTSKPALAYRKIYVEEGHSHNIENLKQMAEWMPKVGYNILVVPTNYQGHGKVKWDNWREDLTPELQKRGIVIEVGGHGYQNFLNAEMENGTLFDKHPEWFGQDAQGKRHREQNWVLCTSNPDAVAYLTNNFVEYVKDRPEIQIYDFWPPDGAKWCECDACKQLGTPSDRQAILVNHIKEAIKTVRPDLRLEIIAYHTALLPPEHAKLDPDVLVDFCPISQQFDHQINDSTAKQNAQYVDALKVWRGSFTGDISIYSYYRKYAWDSLPVIIPHYLQKDLQWYATVPTQGISSYAEPGDWFTYELNHYALAKLAWNLNANVDEIEKEFCEARYHDSAPAALATLKALEDEVRMYCALPNSTLKSADSIQQALSDVRQARKATAKASETESDAVVKHNLDRLALMCDYAVGDLEIQLMRAQNADKAQMREKAVALEKMIQQHAGEGVFLTERLPPGRIQARFGLRKGK